MARKRKQEKNGEVIPLVVPVEPQVEAKSEEKKEEQMLLEVAVPEITEGFLKSLWTDGNLWAQDCGFIGELRVSQPLKVDYPKFGYGFSMTVQEKNGKQRMATARYTAQGERSYWSMDGKVVI